MDWTLELVVVPVSDVERAKAFYSEKLGFNVDHDTKITDEFHVVQLTPPGSGCSIAIGIGAGVNEMSPGSLKGLQLVVPDLPAARAELVERGVDVSEIQVFDRDGGKRAARPDERGELLNNMGFMFFDDPDGNSWAVQQINRS